MLAGPRAGRTGYRPRAVIWATARAQVGRTRWCGRSTGRCAVRACASAIRRAGVRAVRSCSAAARARTCSAAPDGRPASFLGEQCETRGEAVEGVRVAAAVQHVAHLPGGASRRRCTRPRRPRRTAAAVRHRGEDAARCHLCGGPWRGDGGARLYGCARVQPASPLGETRGACVSSAPKRRRNASACGTPAASPRACRAR